MVFYLTEVQIDLNLGSFITFGLGVFFGLVVFTLLYFITSFNVLNKKNETAIQELNKTTEKDINDIIDKYVESFEDECNRRDSVPIEYFKESLLEMIIEVASVFYPNSKRPLTELSIDELITLNRYILNKLEELLSYPVVNLLRKLKLSLVFDILEKTNTIVESKPVQTAKELRLADIGGAILNVLNVLNPFLWFKKLVVEPGVNHLLRKAFKIIYIYLGQETYKIYSKKAMEEYEDHKKLLTNFENDSKEVEKKLLK